MSPLLKAILNQVVKIHMSIAKIEDSFIHETGRFDQDLFMYKEATSSLMFFFFADSVLH